MRDTRTINYISLRRPTLTIPPPPPHARTVDRDHPLARREEPECWGVWWPDAAEGVGTC